MRSQSSAPAFEWFFREPVASGQPLPTSCSSVARKSGRGRAISAARRDASGILVRELAARELAQAIDGGHRVNVDRVHVVDVVVHAAGDRPKLRHHREEQAHVVQLADDRPAAACAVSGTVHTSSTKSWRGLGARAQALAPGRVGGRARDGVARERQHRRVAAARRPRRRAARAPAPSGSSATAADA